MLAVREPSEAPEFTGLPDLLVERLPDSDARALLASVIPGRLDEQVLDRILAETQGNPLALLELPRGLTANELAGGFGLPARLPLSSQIEQSFVRRIQQLPAQTRQLLLVAAVEPVGEPRLLWRAAEQLGIPVDEATAAAEVDGLLYVDAQVRFRHPLVRSAVYRMAGADQRRKAHRALADATDPDVDPDRRAWHRANAAARLDETVAAELERSAGQARRRGGPAAAAAFLERAAALTPDPATRAERSLTAAEAKFEAAAPTAALGLLRRLDTARLDELGLVRLERLHAQIAFALRRGRDAPPLLLKAAERLAQIDPSAAREAFLHALEAAVFVGATGSGRGATDVAEAARTIPAPGGAPRAADLLLAGLAVRFTEGFSASVPALRRALDAFRARHDIRWGSFAGMTASELWDDEAWYVLALRQVELVREAGALSLLPLSLVNLAGLLVHVGDFTAAAALVDEAGSITTAAGSAGLAYAEPLLAAWRGQEELAAELIEANLRDGAERGEGRMLMFANHSAAVLHIGFARYQEALRAAQKGTSEDHLGMAPRILPELVEAAARSGNAGVAEAAVQRLADVARISGTDWARGVEARSRALLSEGGAAEELYLESLERLGRSRIATQLARTHLLYGEWLRRERRRGDARDQLRTAHEMFSVMGAEAFAERAARELLATGEHARRRTVETLTQLTAQEAQIARLARDGLSNPEIGARLFISPRTVEYHLAKVFGKLGIESRNQLDRALSATQPAQPV